MLTDDPRLQPARRVVPRLGPRLLVRAGQGQHLRQALRLAAGRPAARLRPQVHLLAHRLQPQGHRHAGGPGAGAARQAAAVRRRRRRELPPPARRPGRPREHSPAPRSDAPSSDPSWFGFPIAVRGGRPVLARELVDAPREPRGSPRDSCSPATSSASRRSRDTPHRVAGSLVALRLRDDAVFWVGVYPGLSNEAIDYIAQTLRAAPAAMARAER